MNTGRKVTNQIQPITEFTTHCFNSCFLFFDWHQAQDTAGNGYEIQRRRDALLSEASRTFLGSFWGLTFFELQLEARLLWLVPKGRRTPGKEHRVRERRMLFFSMPYCLLELNWIYSIWFSASCHIDVRTTYPRNPSLLTGLSQFGCRVRLDSILWNVDTHFWSIAL